MTKEEIMHNKKKRIKIPKYNVHCIQVNLQKVHFKGEKFLAEGDVEETEFKWRRGQNHVEPWEKDTQNIARKVLAILDPYCTQFI